MGITRQHSVACANLSTLSMSTALNSAFRRVAPEPKTQADYEVLFAKYEADILANQDRAVEEVSQLVQTKRPS